jgi:urease accessory protein
MEEVLLLTRRQATRPLQLAQHWRLALRADERTQLRGRRHCQDGQAVLLQLPRQEPLQPGEWLLPPAASESGTAMPPVAVEVLAAREALLEVRSPHPLALLQAAYHLGNRHVAMELHPHRLLVPDDSVLADLLQHRGLQVERLEAPFRPEPGAYGGSGHGHHH